MDSFVDEPKEKDEEETKMPELTAEQKLQQEAQKLLREKEARVYEGIRKVLDAEGMDLVVDHTIKIIQRQQR